MTDRRTDGLTDGQRSLGNRVPFVPLGYGTLKMMANNDDDGIPQNNTCAIHTSQFSQYFNNTTLKIGQNPYDSVPSSFYSFSCSNFAVLLYSGCREQCYTKSRYNGYYGRAFKGTFAGNPRPGGIRHFKVIPLILGASSFMHKCTCVYCVVSHACE